MANHQSDTMSAHTYNLTPGQEDLLTAALNSNKPNDPQSNGTNGWVSTLDNGLDSILYPHVPGSAGTMNEYRMDFLKGPEDLDFSLDSIDAGADYDDDFDDQSPVNESAEPHEKRQRSDEDASKDDAGSKRQEGVEKVPKKPGRKPLTVEPTNKRKAQNRAAQRAFRERKEKHLKDMETRVEELEKASADANSENGILKAKIERLQNELRDYKKRLSLNSSTFSQANPMSNQLSMFLANNNSAANNTFNFEIPQFGNLPTATTNIFGNTELTTSPTSATPQSNGRQSSIGAAMGASGLNGRSASPQSQGRASISKSSAIQASASRQNSSGVQIESINNDALAGLFGSVSPTATPASQPTQTLRQNSTSSSSATSYPNRIFQFNSNAASTASPSASSNSHYDQSSCATSPEPTTNSPALRNKDSIAETTNNSQTSPFMTFANSLSPTSLAKSLSPPNQDIDNTQQSQQPQKGIDWFAAQNGGQFDPALFGDYRESQMNIVGDGDFTGGFFADALAAPNDFNSPSSNLFNWSYLTTGFTPAIQKANPLEQADLFSAGIDSGNVPVQTTQTTMGCGALMNQLSQRKDFQDGSFDIDGLCEELKKKAKCTGGGVSIEQSDIDEALKRRQGQQQSQA